MRPEPSTGRNGPTDLLGRLADPCAEENGLSEWREGYVSGGGTRFYVRALGHGPDLTLLLHGWPETGDAWRRVAPLLAGAGYRVVCPDMKGFGRTTSDGGGYSSRTLSDEVAQLIRNLHVRKAIVVGHDWGGAVALGTAFRHPGRVRALVLANSPYRRLDLRHAWHVPLFNLPVLPEVAFRLHAQRLVGAAIRYSAVVHEAFPDEVVAAYAEGVSSDPGGWLAYYRTLSRRAVADRLVRTVRRRLPIVSRAAGPHRLRVPTTVVWGAEDPVLRIDQGRETAEDLDASFVPIPGVGHFPHEEAPRAFAQAVLDHVGPATGDEALRAAVT